MTLANLHESNNGPSGLAERLDPAIGEASTRIGLLLSELVRRSLRTGVNEIDQFIHALASDQVDAAVAAKMPELAESAEQIAREVSESTVQRVADRTEQVAERADQIAGRTEEIAQQAQQIDAKADRISQEAEQIARQTDELGRKSEQIAESLSQSLNTAVDRLGSQLSATQRRSEDTDRMLQEVRERARQTWKKIKGELEELQTTNRQLQGELAAAAGKITALEHSLQQALRELTERCKLSDSRADDLEKRIAKLERPKGLSALFQRLRGKSQPAAPSTPTASESDSGEAGGSERESLA